MELYALFEDVLHVGILCQKYSDENPGYAHYLSVLITNNISTARNSRPVNYI